MRLSSEHLRRPAIRRLGVKARRTQDEQNESALLLKADMRADIRQLRLRADFVAKLIGALQRHTS
jgi:hypothetical protein